MAVEAHRAQRPGADREATGGLRLYARRPVLLGGLVLVLVLVAMASAVVLSQGESRTRIRANFQLRGQSGATFISTFLADQATRMGQTGRGMLAGAHVPAASLRVTARALGGSMAVLVGAGGRTLGAVSFDGSSAGDGLVQAWEHQLHDADHARVRISDRGPPTGRAGPDVTISVAFQTTHGRRVLGIAYPIQGSALEEFVMHAVPYPEHQVLLLDAHDRVLAASPATRARTLAGAAPRLARAVARGPDGEVGGTGPASTFTTAPVAGTPWRLVLAVPGSTLYASIGGWESRVPWIVFALVGIFGCSLLALFARSLHDRARLSALSATLEETAQTDPLTGLYNRRALSERFVRAAAQARRRGEPLSVLMIDLDYFKQTNDRYGHEAGDRVLRIFADCMRSACRAEDIYGRWGGDEFLAALPATDEPSALALAERLRRTVADRERADIGVSGRVRFSVGVASGLRMPPDLLAQMADEALYESKAAGRGRTTTAHEPLGIPRESDLTQAAVSDLTQAAESDATQAAEGLTQDSEALAQDSELARVYPGAARESPYPG